MWKLLKYSSATVLISFRMKSNKDQVRQSCWSLISRCSHLKWRWQLYCLFCLLFIFYQFHSYSVFFNLQAHLIIYPCFAFFPIIIYVYITTSQNVKILWYPYIGSPCLLTASFTDQSYNSAFPQSQDHHYSQYSLSSVCLVGFFPLAE